jgi:hypothetical protein
MTDEELVKAAVEANCKAIGEAALKFAQALVEQSKAMGELNTIITQANVAQSVNPEATQ